MHPLNSKNFGANSIKVKYNNGSSVVDGYVVKQVSFNTFNIAALGSAPSTAFLAQLDTAVTDTSAIPALNPLKASYANAPSACFTIEVIPVVSVGPVVYGPVEHIKSIEEYKLITVEGHTYFWTNATPTQVGYAAIPTIPALTLSAPSNAAIVQGTVYNDGSPAVAALTVGGSPASPLVWKVNGTLLSGLSIDASGNIVGTVAAAGTVNGLTITVTDAIGRSVTSAAFNVVAS